MPITRDAFLSLALQKDSPILSTKPDDMIDIDFKNDSESAKKYVIRQTRRN